MGRTVQRCLVETDPGFGQEDSAVPHLVLHFGCVFLATDGTSTLLSESQQSTTGWGWKWASSSTAWSFWPDSHRSATSSCPQPSCCLHAALAGATTNHPPPPALALTGFPSTLALTPKSSLRHQANQQQGSMRDALLAAAAAQRRSKGRGKVAGRGRIPPTREGKTAGKAPGTWGGGARR